MKLSNANSSFPLCPPHYAPRDSELTSNDRISAFVPSVRSMRANPEPSSITDEGDRPATAPRDPFSVAYTSKAASGLVDDDEEYEVLQESGILPSEDEAETVSSFSLEGPMADDVRSVTSNSNESEQSVDEEEPEPVFEPSDSGMTARPSIETIHSSMTSEHLARNASTLDTGLGNDSKLHVVDHVQPLDRMHFDESTDEESNELWELRFRTSGKVLRWAGSFRILFFGPFNEAYKEIIMSAIARALQVGQDIPEGFSSRLSVVPVSSFGGDRCPEVELIPITGFDLVHENCDGVRFPDANPPSISLHLESKQDRPVNADGRNHLRRFDLAVAAASSGPSFTSFRRAMNAQGTPVLTVALPLQEVVYSETIDLFGDEKSMMIQVKDENHRVTGVRPVPLNVFNSLDSRHLNQHLDCIGVEDKPKTLDQNSKVGALTRKGSLLKSFSSFGARIRDDRAFRNRVILQTLMSFFLVLGIYQAASHFGPSHDMASQQDALSSEIARFVNVSKPALTQDSSVIPRTDRSSASGFPGEKVSRISAPKATDKPVSKSLGQLAPRLNDSDEFKVHIVGDYHFVLTPPGKLRSFKHPTKFDVQVRRGSSPVHSEGERLVDGVYAVKLDRKDAHGVLNVTVWTLPTKKKTEPSLLQHLAIDFGSEPWYTIDGWNSLASTALNKARTDLMVMQLEVANKSMQLYSDLQRAGGNAHDTSSKAVQQTLQLLNETVAAAHKRADGLLQAWKGTTSLQIPAPPVQKAHRNAAGLVGKVRAKYDALWEGKKEALMAECKENRGRGLSCGKLNAKALKELHKNSKKPLRSDRYMHRDAGDP